MRKASPEKFIRRNITLPESFGNRIDHIRQRGGYVSESEVFRQSVLLLDALTDPGKEVFLKEKGKKQRVFVPTAK